jgi:hypothetical protein
MGEGRHFKVTSDEGLKILTLLLQTSNGSSPQGSPDSQSGKHSLAVAVLAGQTITQASAEIHGSYLGFRS